MSQFKTLSDYDVAGKRVILRADLNVPMKDGVVTDSSRIDRTLPTIQELVEKGARVVLITHWGRPKGERVAEMTVKPVAEALASKLGKDVKFADDCIGDVAADVVNGLANGDVCVLENLRYYTEETDNDLDFAKKLASMGDIYVNDAFSCAHRAHASTEALARLLPAAAGRLMQAELEALSSALEAPKRPLAALVGGAKVSSKLDVLENLSKKVDMLIIGGGMANTFLHAQGINVGKSLCEHDLAETALKILKTADEAGCKILLPVDAVVAKEFGANVENRTVDVADIAADEMMLDVGPASIAEIKEQLSKCKTIVWNGPMGAFEIEPFDKGTNGAAQAAAQLTKAGSLVSVAGGGDTVAALDHAGVKEDFTYISTAGGAFLEWLEGKELPGVEVLRSVS